MNIMRVNDSLTVSGQLSESDVAQLAADGVELIVCNRPDGEADDQVPFADIAAAAKAAGIQAASIPFRSGAMSDEDVAAFAVLLANDRNIHCYCRTGTRSFGLYAAAAASKGADLAEIREQANRLGFDVSTILRPYIQENQTP